MTNSSSHGNTNPVLAAAARSHASCDVHPAAEDVRGHATTKLPIACNRRETRQECARYRIARSAHRSRSPVTTDHRTGSRSSRRTCQRSFQILLEFELTDHARNVRAVVPRARRVERERRCVRAEAQGVARLSLVVSAFIRFRRIDSPPATTRSETSERGR